VLDHKPLRYFLVLADTLHFGQAAARLHMSQPPLSRQIAALEASVGTALFERSPRGVALTAAGEQLQRDARALLAGLERAGANARDAAAGSLGALAIGFTMYAAFTVVPRLAKRFRAAFPGVKLTLHEIVTHDLERQVLDGHIDLGVMLPVPPRPGLVQTTVYREPLCVALPKTHRLAATRAFALAQLAADPFIAAPRDATPGLRSAIDEQCRAAGFEPQISIEASLQQTIISLVAEGVGVALVPASMRKMRVAGVVFKNVRDAREIEQVIGWSRANRNPCLPAFLDLAAPAPPAPAAR